MRAGFISWTTDGLTISFYFILMGTLIVISTRFLKFFSMYVSSFKLRDLPIPCNLKIISHLRSYRKVLLDFQNQLFKPAVDELLIRRTKKN